MRRTIPTLYETAQAVAANNSHGIDQGALESLRLYISSLKTSLHNEIDKLVNDLRNQVMDPGQPSKGKFLDHLKSWWTNLWYADHDQRNPYFWQNRIGSLGRNESTQLTIYEHRMFQELAFLLEDQSALGMPRMTTILNKWKVQINDIIGQYLDALGSQVDNLITQAPASVNTPEMPGVDPEDEETKSVEEPKKPLPVKDPVHLGNMDDKDEEFDDESEEDEEIEPSIDPEPFIEADRDPEIPSEVVNAAGQPNRKYFRRVKRILMHMANMTDEEKNKITPQKKIIYKMIYKTVWAPWTSTGGDREDWNARGGRLPSHATKSGEPNGLPYVLRIGDPRRAILETWYPKLWKKLRNPTGGDMVRRVELGPNDDGGPDQPDWAEKRKQTMIDASNRRIEARIAAKKKRIEKELPSGPDEVAAKRLEELANIKDILDGIDADFIADDARDALNKALEAAKADDTKLKMLNKWITLYEQVMKIIPSMSEEDKEVLKSHCNDAATSGDIKVLYHTVDMALKLQRSNSVVTPPESGMGDIEDDEDDLKSLLSHTTHNDPLINERTKYLRMLLAEQAQTGRVVKAVSRWRNLPFENRLQVMIESLRR